MMGIASFVWRSPPGRMCIQDHLPTSISAARLDPAPPQHPPAQTQCHSSTGQHCHCPLPCALALGGCIAQEWGKPCHNASLQGQQRLPGPPPPPAACSQWDLAECHLRAPERPYCGLLVLKGEPIRKTGKNFLAGPVVTEEGVMVLK